MPILLSFEVFQLRQVILGVLFSYKHVREGKGTVYSVDRWTSLFGAVRGRFPKGALEDKRIIFNEASLFSSKEYFKCQHFSLLFC